MFDTRPAGIEGTDRSEHAVAEGTEELKRGSEAFWVWAPQGKGWFSFPYLIFRIAIFAFELGNIPERSIAISI